MKQRVLSAIVALVLLAIVLSLFDTLVLNAAVAAVAVIGLYEFFHATKIDSNKALCLIGYAAAAVIPFIPHALCMKILPAALLPAIGLFLHSSGNSPQDPGGTHRYDLHDQLGNSAVHGFCDLYARYIRNGSGYAVSGHVFGRRMVQ